jgi:hypothetical protein
MFLNYFKIILKTNLHNIYRFARGIKKGFSKRQGLCSYAYRNTCFPRVIHTSYGELTDSNQFQVACRHWNPTYGDGSAHFFAMIRDYWRPHIDIIRAIIDGTAINIDPTECYHVEGTGKRKPSCRMCFGSFWKRFRDDLKLNCASCEPSSHT